MTRAAIPKAVLSAIAALENAAENLGSIDGSYGWNAANDRVEKAEKALIEAIQSALEDARK